MNAIPANVAGVPRIATAMKVGRDRWSAEAGIASGALSKMVRGGDCSTVRRSGACLPLLRALRQNILRPPMGGCNRRGMQTFEQIEEQGLEAWLADLRLRKTYLRNLVRRVNQKASPALG
jgi:hypothetical protein